MGLDLVYIAIWWLAIEITGLIALPIASYICRNIKDHGYSISKPLGLLLLTYVSWIISAFAGYSVFSILFSLGIIAVCSYIVHRRNGLFRIDRNYIIRFEILFLFAFVGFSFIRAYSPDIYWTGGEKFMDMAFINSLVRTADFPPPDPWMSGTVIYYYYFGYLIVANLIKITGILPSAAFNLAAASFFALSLTSAFGIGYNLTEKTRYGIITAFFVVIAGNLVGFFQFMDILFVQKGDVINNVLTFNYWTSSRVIPDTINEFPFFSFLQGDVHAHMISITFQLLIILLLLNFMKSRTLDTASIFVLGLSIGFLYPLNTWDYPVYLFLAIFVMASHFFLSGSSQFGPGSSKGLAVSIAAIGATAALSYFLYLPYHISYEVERAVSFVPSGRTSLIYYLAINGLFLFLIYSHVILTSKKYNQNPVYFIVFLIMISVISAVLEFELLIVLIPLLILSVISIFKEKDENSLFLFILIITGILLSLFCELFYIKDALGSGNPAYIRLNTVFKFYLPNWLLWGVSAGAVLYKFRDHFIQKRIWSVIALLLIMMVSIYPVFATIGKSGAFRGEPTLDGEAYVKKEHPQEYMAILWFRNITGQPVVLQAPGESYKWNTYVTALTGLPTVTGWAGHEITWKMDFSEINARRSDVDNMYTSLDPEAVDVLLRKYDVSYIYFGDAEAKRYSGPRLFEAHPERFEKVFEYGDVVVYRVNPNR